jgi:UDP-glucose 4-epimerase
VRALTGGFDAVQHLAAQSFPTDHPETPELPAFDPPPFDTTMNANIMGTYYLLHAALQSDVSLFVMTGSNCALGHGYRISDAPFPIQSLPIDEDHPCAVEDSYAFSKLAAEELLASYTRAYGMRTYAVRAAGICDADERRAMARDAAPCEAWSPWLWGWVGSEDVALAHRLLMEKAEDIEPHGVFFCHADDTDALEPTRELIARFRPELATWADRLTGHDALLSNQRLQDAVGWRHTTSWREHLPG